MSARAVLPCDSKEEWEGIKTFLLVLSQSSSPEDLSVLSTSTVPNSLSEHQRRGRRLMLSFLSRYTKECCTAKERAKFFKTILPCLCRLASQLPSILGTEGVPFVRAQEETTVHISKKVVASLLANCFLCTFPEATAGNSFPFSFSSFFSPDSFVPSQTARCKCFLLYFEKIAEQRLKLGGFIKLQRKVSQYLNSLETWKRQRTPLCSFRIEGSKKIEDCGTLTLQADFANAYIGGGVLQTGCVQEEIRFTICPELLVSRLIMERMDSNEAIVITGYERCSNYKGYGWSSFSCTGERNDDSQRDDVGAPMSHLVAIDALEPDEEVDQFSSVSVLRDLNKALTGFSHHGNQGDLQRDRTTHLLGKSVVVSNSSSTSSASSALHLSERDGTAKRDQLDSVEAGLRRHNLVPREISFPVPVSVLPPVEEASGPPDLNQFSESLAHMIIRDVRTGPPPTTSSVPTPTTISDLVSGGGSVVDGVVESSRGRLVVASEPARAVGITMAGLVQNGSVGAGSGAESGDSVGRGHLPGGVVTAEELLSSGKRSSSVQFMLDLKHLTWSRASNASTRSVIGSDPDPSGISTVSHFSSRSSSVAGGQALATSLEDYSESLCGQILSQAVRNSGSPDSSSGSAHTGGGEHRGNPPVSAYVDGLVGSIFSSTVGELTSSTSSTDGLPSLDITTVPKPPPPSSHFPPPSTSSVLAAAAAQGSSSDDFAARLSQKLIQEATLRSHSSSSEHSPVRHSGGGGGGGLAGSQQRSSASQLLSLDRIRRAPSTDAVWSTAPTMDQDSSPPSPGELDAMAMDYASNISEYADLLAFKCMADSIRSLTGQEIYESFDEATGRLSSRDTQSEDHHSLPSLTRLVDIHRVLLRPVVTGNWGCEAFRGDPQLKSLLQWIAVSASGRPEMVYCTLREKKLAKLKSVIAAIEKRGLNVGSLALLVFRCSEKHAHQCLQKSASSLPTGGDEDFFSVVLKELVARN